MGRVIEAAAAAHNWLVKSYAFDRVMLHSGQYPNSDASVRLNVQDPEVQASAKRWAYETETFLALGLGVALTKSKTLRSAVKWVGLAFGVVEGIDFVAKKMGQAPEVDFDNSQAHHLGLEFDGA